MDRITAQDAEARSADIKADNIAQLKALFPELITESAAGATIDVDVLKQLVGDATVSGAEEKYGLNWHGKRRARQLALMPSTGTLRPCPEDSVDWETTQNLMIEGDNLEVLKLLQKSYAGKVKLIYIDPPYNTGKDFVYPDNFQDSIRNYLELTGQVEGGRKISSNTEASGRFHTDWLNMIYPRLKLARTLLQRDGVIFISIDENETHNLRAVMDDIFGEENFVNTIIVKTKESSGASGGGEDRKLKKNVESLLLYCREMDAFSRTEIFGRELLSEVIAEKRADGKTYEYRQVLTKTGTPEFVSCLQDGAGEEIKVFRNVGYEFQTIDKAALAAGVDVDEAYVLFHSQIFRTTNAQTSIRTRVQELLGPQQGLFSIEYVPRSGKDKNMKVTKYFYGPSTDLLVWLRDTSVVEDGQVVKLQKTGTLWDDLAWTGIAKEGGVEFSNGKKPVSFIQRMLSMCLADDSDEIVMDFFAGSGTTGQAVWEANTATNGRRRLLLVQLPEPLDPEIKDQRTGADFCDELGKPRNITELTKERLRRAGKKIKSENRMFGGDLGFRVYKLDQSNIRAWQPSGELEKDLVDSVEHIVPGRSEQDVLTELLLKLGLDLCVPIERRTISGKTVNAIGGGVLLVCLDTRIAAKDAEQLALGIAEWRKALSPAGETTCVFRDSAFENDVAKTNLAGILDQHGIQHVRSL